MKPKQEYWLYGIVVLAIIGVVFISGCMQAPTETPVQETKIPYYFVAIHNEPNHMLGGEEMREKAYPVLEQIVDKANEYNIKLTIMFSAQMADMIAENPERLAKIKEWEKQGHEISAHHHGVRHSNWDGYTDYTEE